MIEPIKGRNAKYGDIEVEELTCIESKINELIEEINDIKKLIEPSH